MERQSIQYLPPCYIFLMIHEKIFIGFDLDGVILDHAPNKIRLAKTFGFKIKKRHFQAQVIKLWT